MMHASCPDWAAKLIDILDQQRCLYLQLQHVGDQQGRIFSELQPDVNELILLLGRRKDIIHQLVLLNSQIDPFRREWSSLWRSLDSIWQDKIQELIHHTQSLLEAISSQDVQDRNLLGSQRQRLTQGQKHDVHWGG